jgi:hypothetical protein
VYELAANRHRRLAVRVLAEQAPMTLTRLVGEVVCRDRGLDDVDAVDTHLLDETRQVFRHKVIPELVEYEIVSHSNRVRLTLDARSTELLLALLDIVCPLCD